MLSILVTLLMLQAPTPAERKATCEEGGDYFKTGGGGTCLTSADDSQLVLFKDLKQAEFELATALSKQQQFNNASAIARKTDFDARIAALETARDATSDRPADAFQAEIDKLTEVRDRLNSTDPGSERDKASQLGPVVSQLNQDISDLKRDLDASIP